jgi:hypothetical protein
MCFADLSATWTTDVLAVDACESGFAVMKSSWAVKDVEEVGRWDERWRFKSEDPAALCPRRRALQHLNEDFLDDPWTVSPALDGIIRPGPTVDKTFPDVPPERLQQKRWSCLFAGRFNR